MKKFLALLVTLALLVCFVPQVWAACTQTIPTQAKSSWLGGMFSLSDTYKVAFYNTSAVWNATTAQYSTTNEMTGSNYTAGGFTLGTLTIAVDATTAYMDWPDEVNNNVTFNLASTCLIIYDDTIANSSCTAANDPWDCCSGSSAGTCADSVLYVGTFSSVQPSNGTLTITFPTADASNAIIRISRFFEELLSPTPAYAEPLRVDALVELTGVLMFSPAR